MTAKHARILGIAALLAACVLARPAVCQAWSLLHPFSSDSQAKAKEPVVRTAQKPPTAWDSVTSGTKNFFNKTGEAIGLKKPAKKTMPQYAYAKPPVIQKQKPEKQSWIGSLFKPTEPKKPKDVGEWMERSKRIDP